MKKYSPLEVENKWQKKWEEGHLHTPDIKSAKKPFYNLWMFPYPSAEGLHAGHAFASTGSDIYGRFMRMKGWDVFQPIGYDSFGIHSENYAIKIGEPPQKMVARTTKHYESQLRSLGHMYDWTRGVTTSDGDYYKWTQWLFIEMFKAGLAYKKKASVNFCPSCKTVLADEQIMTPAQAGKMPAEYKNLDEVPEGVRVCERCGSIPEKRELDQWFFKITDYAERLLGGLSSIDWSPRVLTAQREWIGKTSGTNVKFQVKPTGEEIEVFTTRLDTIFGVTFIVLSPEYAQRMLTILPEKSKAKVLEYIKISLNKSEQQRKMEEKEKSGIDSGLLAINPANGAEIPIYVADYVLSGVGTGAVMGVPFLDARDKDFAAKHKIQIKKTSPAKPDDLLPLFNKGIAQEITRYHLRDWLVSRQRYWGAPIPMISCQKCGWQPVSEKDLPVTLPEISDYRPKGEGKGPLADHPEFYKTTCPNCGGEAMRETDVMDTFVDSSWYFLRYPSVGIDDVAFDPSVTKKWLPVSLYFGGAEHSVLHLMYARFVTMVLFDRKFIDFEEPFPRFFAHGLMIKDGAKMSKSRGNVVNPDDYVSKYGADTLRFYLMFMGPMDGSPDFRDTGIEGMGRFIRRLWGIFTGKTSELDSVNKAEVYSKMHQTIKRVTKDIEAFHYNTAIAAIMEFVNVVSEKGADETVLTSLALLLAPFTPHLAEEVWCEVLGKSFSVHTSPWPGYDDTLTVSDTVTIPVQVNGKLRSQLMVGKEESMLKDEIEKLALKDIKIDKWVQGKKIKKTVFVPGKLINLVI